GRAADGGGAKLAGGERDQLARGAKAGRAKERAPRVDVVRGLLSRRERHLADHERVLPKLREERAASRFERGVQSLRGRRRRRSRSGAGRIRTWRRGSGSARS